MGWIKICLIKPIPSMYGIFSDIYHKNIYKHQPNVGIYTIHGRYGDCNHQISGIVDFCMFVARLRLYAPFFWQEDWPWYFWGSDYPKEQTQLLRKFLVFFLTPEVLGGSKQFLEYVCFFIFDKRCRNMMNIWNVPIMMKRWIDVGSHRIHWTGMFAYTCKMNIN